MTVYIHSICQSPSQLTQCQIFDGLFDVMCKGPFTLSICVNDAVSLAILLWSNSLDFLINQASHHKMSCNPNWSDIMQALNMPLQQNHANRPQQGLTSIIILTLWCVYTEQDRGLGRDRDQGWCNWVMIMFWSVYTEPRPRLMQISICSVHIL